MSDRDVLSPQGPTAAGEEPAAEAPTNAFDALAARIGPLRLQRKLAERLARRRANAAAPADDAASGSGEAALSESEAQRKAGEGVSGGGGEVPHRAEMEQRFGTSFGDVRAHHDASAQAACDAIGAVAYTAGNHIAFRGAPDPKLVAHELTHVVQQRGVMQPSTGVDRPGDSYEVEADAVAARATAGQSVRDVVDRHERGVSGERRAAFEPLAEGGTAERRAGPDAARAGRDGTAIRPAWAFQRLPAAAVSPWGRTVQRQGAAHLSHVRIDPGELPADGKSTAKAIVHVGGGAKGGTADVHWAFDGADHGSHIDAKTGAITAGSGLKGEKANLTIKATDASAKGGKSSATGHLMLWEEKYYQAKKDYPKFAAGTYTAAAPQGKFKVTYRPSAHHLDALMKLEFRYFDDNVHNPKDKWTPKRKAEYERQFITQSRAAWSAKYTFDNAREPKTMWGKLDPVHVDFKIQSVASGGDYVVEAHRHLDKVHPTADLGPDGKIDQWKHRAALHGGTTLKVFQGNEKLQKGFNQGSAVVGEQKHLDRMLPPPVLFDFDSAVPKSSAKLDEFATYLKRIHEPKINVKLTGRASTPGADEYNRQLALRRAQAVAAKLRGAGVTQHAIAVHSEGEKGAGKGAEWRRVDVAAVVDPNWRNDFRTFPHETGHLLGLGDEYAYATGDAKHASRHSALVEEMLGKDYAEEVANQADDPTANIMHFGKDVRPHDYVTFWAALGAASETAPVPTPKMTRADWKING